MKLFVSLFLLMISVGAIGQTQYDYPTDPITKKISYKKEITVDGNKEKLYQRALQFLAIQDFDRSLNILDHRNDPQTLQNYYQTN